jgi:protein-L-isoaspartate(D-aspartate) O-methyltransferase
MLANGQIEIIQGDGRLGYPQEGPYDAIHVGAAASGTIPQSLIDQLKAPGRMLIPVEENYAQHVWQVDKDRDGSVCKKRTCAVMYVPLTDARKFVGYE